jgi:hypothetical protein
MSCAPGCKTKTKVVVVAVWSWKSQVRSERCVGAALWRGRGNERQVRRLRGRIEWATEKGMARMRHPAAGATGLAERSSKSLVFRQTHSRCYLLPVVGFIRLVVLIGCRCHYTETRGVTTDESPSTHSLGRPRRGFFSVVVRPIFGECACMFGHTYRYSNASRSRLKFPPPLL